VSKKSVKFVPRKVALCLRLAAREAVGEAVFDKNFSRRTRRAARGFPVALILLCEFGTRPPDVTGFKKNAAIVGLYPDFIE